MPGVSTDVAPLRRLGPRPNPLSSALHRRAEQDAKSGGRHQERGPPAFQKRPPGDSSAFLIPAPGDFLSVGFPGHENLPEPLIEHHHAPLERRPPYGKSHHPTW